MHTIQSPKNNEVEKLMEKERWTWSTCFLINTREVWTLFLL